jgi:hypothetical protein
MDYHTCVKRIKQFQEGQNIEVMSLYATLQQISVGRKNDECAKVFR